MAKIIQNQIAVRVNEDVAHPIIAASDENERLMGEYMVPPLIKSRSN